MTIELRHFRCFLAIAETLSITRAAERLHLTQPAVSRTLHRLEQELGIRLVDRSTHHLALTPDGRAFRDRARIAVTAFDRALATAHHTDWPLRLGHAWSAAGTDTTALLRRWREEHPGTPLELLRIDDRTAGLARGDVDAALLRGEVRAPGLVTEQLTTEPRVAGVPADDPLAGRASLSLAELTDRTIALNTVSGITTLDLWPAGARPASSITTGNADDWIAAITGRRAVGVTTSATAEMHPHPAMAYVPLTDAPPVPVVLAWRDEPGHPRIPDLIALARDVIGRATGGEPRRAR
ncbi:LysR family transcriptional regulator [Streptomyces sioyaensis]|uniref:LysR family transcriptional regulator n=1 Tax=Streptomyces sioyaensis TaxID=67364 RepID=A0A4Q1R2U9_9ACTN|nr:LysR family transcriptional regulator [Streptomyces sioyaensis]MBM4794059.1 LysR family transcriptional regulator [Streptomyces sioyaensis]RXS65473.1 LysR family transcriptional regulator [Streptomyces sioyaensis]